MSEAELSKIIESADTPSRGKKIIWLLLLLALGVGGYFFWKSRAKAEANGISYITEPMERGDLKLYVIATGKLAPINEVTIGSELSGLVKEVLVDTNDRVIQGQVLARLDISKLERLMESAKAQEAAVMARVGQAQATLVEKEAALARLHQLKESSGGRLPSAAQMDEAIAAAERAKADVASANADVRQAQANIGTFESDLEKSVIRSPIDGIILTRSIEPGQTVAATMTAPELFVVAEKLENMKLEVAVAEADVARVSEGQDAVFVVDAWPGRTFQARVSKVEFGSSVTDSVVTYTTQLEVSNNDLSLRPGMTATAEISVAEAKNSWLVSNTAFGFEPTSVTAEEASPQNKSFVQTFIPGPRRRPSGGVRGAGREKASSISAGEPATIWVLISGKPERLSVETILTDGEKAAIRGQGLAEGTKVIVYAQKAGHS